MKSSGQDPSNSLVDVLFDNLTRVGDDRDFVGLGATAGAKPSYSIIRNKLIQGCLKNTGLKSLAEGIMIRASSFSRMGDVERRWMKWGVSLSDETLDASLREWSDAEANENKDNFFTHENRWVFIQPLFESHHLSPGHRGFAVAIVNEETNDFDQIIAALKELGHALELGLRWLRRQEDRLAVQKMAAWLASHKENEVDVLGGISKILMKHTRSDGVKIYLLRQRPEGLMVQSLCWSREHTPKDHEYPIEEFKGLADWVILNQKWLLVERPAGPYQTEMKKAICRTKNQERVEVMARKEGKPPTHDRESSLFLYPLRIDDRVCGAISIWRLGDWDQRQDGRFDDIYDTDLDLTCLVHFSSQVAASTRWWVHRQLIEEKSKALVKLGQMVNVAESLPRVYQTVAAHAAQLAQITRGILLLREKRDKVFVATADWTAGKDDDHQAGHNWLFLLSEEQVLGRGAKLDILEQQANLLQSPWGALTCSEKKYLASGLGKSHGQASLLAFSPKELAFHKNLKSVEEEIAHKVATDFLSESLVILESFVKAFTQRAIQEMGVKIREVRDPGKVLHLTADHLREKNQCDAVLVYLLDKDGMKVNASSPEDIQAIGKEVKPDTLTERTIKEKRPYRVLDVSNPQLAHVKNINHVVLEKFAKLFTWKGIRSWYTFPVEVGGKIIGLFKLLTSDSGIFLGDWHEEVVRGIAQFTATEMEKLNQTLILENINLLTDKLAAKEGSELEEEIKNLLIEWVRKTIGFNTSFAVVANVNTLKPKIFVCSEEISVKQTNKLEAKSEDLITEDFKTFKTQGDLVLATPIRVRGDESLKGHVFFLGKEHYSGLDRFAAKELAREIANILERERRRIDITQMMSKFRHALLGPVQGMQSAAEELYDLFPPEKKGGYIEELKEQLEEESEKIRDWRLNQRLYTDERPALFFRGESFKGIAQNAHYRFKKIFEEQKITLYLAWRLNGDIYFKLDKEGIELVLANLLENASKYAFRGSDVVLGVKKIDDSWIQIWVEDYGHPIPEHLKEAVYEMGIRLDWKDTTRSIKGTGLGLPMSKRIVEGHGGKLYHENIQSSVKKQGANFQASKVTFYVELPMRRKNLV